LLLKGNEPAPEPWALRLARNAGILKLARRRLTALFVGVEDSLVELEMFRDVDDDEAGAGRSVLRYLLRGARSAVVREEK
jgi:hypothetical protein